MERSHSMPFGAECRDDGSVRFRLWATAAHQVELCLPTAGRQCTRLAMHQCDGGWFEIFTDAARSGSLYHFRINDAKIVPDPASRFQTQDVHGPSEVIDPAEFEWKDRSWKGRRWEEAVVYELHVGTFTPAGTFAGVLERLDYLADLGITALELMPVADFPGKRNWGYDGVLPFAPDSSYGRPEDLKQLVQSAHQRGIMILLDVVYNHFGPEGNYLNSYAPQFFTDRRRTPWGDAINFDGPESRTVRDFFIHNALYWLEEYRFDGLRLDAVHAITDASKPDILTELADKVRSSIGPDRHVHLVLENDRNQARYLRRDAGCQARGYTAQWNDDIHHAMHSRITGESGSYYSDYSGSPLEHLGRCLTEGLAYQGEPSPYRRGDARGESTAGIPLTAFVSFLQNHDHIGNRAFGERIVNIADARAVRAAMAILLLAPSPPLLFMGEEFGADTPFYFFCDFHPELAAAVTAGRRNEFANSPGFSDPAQRERIPDPSLGSTFEASRLDWGAVERPGHQDWLRFYRELLKLRRQYVVPRLFAACDVRAAEYEIHKNRGLSVRWKFPDGSTLRLQANLDANSLSGMTSPDSQIIYATPELSDQTLMRGILPAWCAVWSVES